MSAYCPKCGKKFEETRPNWRYCNRCGSLVVKNVIFFLGLVIILPKGRQRHRYRAFYDFLEKIFYKPKHARTFIDVLAKPVDIIDAWVESFYKKFDSFMINAKQWLENSLIAVLVWAQELKIKIPNIWSKIIMTVNEKIDHIAKAIEILARKLYNVIGGETYYAVCEELNKTLDDLKTE